MSKTLNNEALVFYKALRAEVDAMSVGFQNLQKMGEILSADVKKSVAVAKRKDGGDSANRAVVRATFAWVEGLVFCM